MKKIILVWTAQCCMLEIIFKALKIGAHPKWLTAFLTSLQNEDMSEDISTQWREAGGGAADGCCSTENMFLHSWLEPVFRAKLNVWNFSKQFSLHLKSVGTSTIDRHQEWYIFLFHFLCLPSVPVSLPFFPALPFSASLLPSLSDTNLPWQCLHAVAHKSTSERC